jgi:hypothetical protein
VVIGLEDPVERCAVLSQAVCARAGLDQACLAAACRDGLPALDQALDRPFARLDVDDADLSLAGSAVAVDADHDLIAETLAVGVWSGTLVLDDGESIPISGSFRGE